MDIQSINDLIKSLPTLIIYIVPGFITIWIKSFILSEKPKETSDIFLKSIVISYLLILFEKFVLKLFGYNIDIDMNGLHKVILIIISIFVGYIWSMLLQSDNCSNILKKVGVYRTFRANIWDDLVDLQYGLWVRIYLPSESVIYEGKLRKYEEKENLENYLLVLSNFIMYDYEAKEIINNTTVNNEWIALSTKDISRIELLYNANSKKIISSRESDEGMEMSNSIKISTIRKYKKLFKERFKKESNTLIENDEVEFFINFIEDIKQQYKNQIEEITKDNNEIAVNTYIENEKIRLEVKIKQLETKESGLKYIGSLFSVALPIATFGIGNVVNITKDSVKFVVDNKLKQFSVENDIIDSISGIFNQFLLDMASMITASTVTLVIIVGVGLAALEIVYSINKGKIRRDIEFSKFSLEVLKGIEKEILNNLDDTELETQTN